MINAMSLELKQVSKSFGGVKAVDKVYFHIENSSITGLIGPNGSGKTTLFNLITGFYALDEGEIYYCGNRIDRLRAHERVQRGIIRTFQETKVFPQLTVLDNMLTPTVKNNLANLLEKTVTDEKKDKAVEILEFLGILRLKDEKAGNLSFGQQRLLEFGMLLMVDADLILLDEPSSGINPALLEKIGRWIKKKMSQKALLIIEHNMRFIMNISDHIIVLHHGKKFAEGTPEEIQSSEEVLEAYLGE
jgi:ABC-type branched-subunit amino acid transport system ATPase component